MVRSLSLPLLVLSAVLIADAPSVAQDKKPAPKVPQKVTAQLKPWTDRVKQGLSPVVMERDDGFVRHKEVSLDVKSGASVSDFADKPYVARVSWTGDQQFTKIHADKEKAANSEEWLDVGKIPGKPNVKRVRTRFTATLYHVDGKWELDSLTWSPDFKGIGNAPQARVSSTKQGDKHPWWDALSDVKPKK